MPRRATRHALFLLRWLALREVAKQKHALELNSESKMWQRDNSMELDLGLLDNSVFDLHIMERNRELADLDVEIAKKRLEIFEAGA